MVETKTPPDDDTITAQVDYFAAVPDVKCTFPDGSSWVTLRVLMEGERRRFLNSTNKDITIARASGDAKLALAPGDERYELLKASITGWNLISEGKPTPFDTRSLDLFLEKVNPSIADVIEKRIREVNPWLVSELSIEDIDKEIERLQELRKVRVEEERGKVSS